MTSRKFILLAALALVLSGCNFGEAPDAMEEAPLTPPPTEGAMMEDGEMMESEPAAQGGGLPGAPTEEPNPAADDRDSMVDEPVMEEPETKEKEIETSSAQVLASGESTYYDFDAEAYATALESDKLIVLYFTADWCPICKAELASLHKAFEMYEDDNVIGFEIHFNDARTTDSDKALAKEFGVAYQHTKVFIKNGQRVLKAPDSWNTERYLTEFNNHS